MARRVLTQDYFELLELKQYLDENGGSFETDDLSKETLGQEILDNRYFHDFNLDGVIDNDDFLIAWSWVLQGKPNDVNAFNSDTEGKVWARMLPYQYVQDDEIETEMIPDEETGELVEVVVIEVTIPTADSPAAPYIPPAEPPLPPDVPDPTDPAATTADWDLDGEIDEMDMRILERFLLIQPKSLSEYNLNRGDYPEARVLPNLATAKYACTDLELIGWNDLLIFQEWLNQGKPQRVYQFNKNKAEGIPTACRLPVETYESIGTSTETFDDVYTGEENL